MIEEGVSGGGEFRPTQIGELLQALDTVAGIAAATNPIPGTPDYEASKWVTQIVATAKAVGAVDVSIVPCFPRKKSGRKPQPRFCVRCGAECKSARAAREHCAG